MSEKEKSYEFKHVLREIEKYERHEQNLQNAVVKLLKYVIKTEPEKSVHEKLGKEALVFVGLLTPERQEEVREYQTSLMEQES